MTPGEFEGRPRSRQGAAAAGRNRIDPQARAIFEAGVVHDLGNLIQVATSVIAVLARNPEMPAAEAGPMLDRARTCLDHAGAMVRRNIGLVRGTEAVGSGTDVDACLRDVGILVEAMGERGVQLAFTVEPGLPLARCDRIGLQNAMLNLIFNACDAMPGGGQILIEALSASGALLEEGVEIRVADTGIGMSRATIARAFEPFFTTKSDGLGGVGLPMVRRFIGDAGGDISIRSTLGRGTCVTVRLPAAEGSRPDRR